MAGSSSSIHTGESYVFYLWSCNLNDKLVSRFPPQSETSEHFRGVRKAADLTKPIDKRVYKVISSSNTTRLFQLNYYSFSEFHFALDIMFNVKGTCPTCHDFGPPGCLKTEPAEVGTFSGFKIRTISFQVIPLLVGFSGGQIQLIDPARYNYYHMIKLYLIALIL